MKRALVQKYTLTATDTTKTESIDEILIAIVKVLGVPKDVFILPGCTDSSFTIPRRIFVWLVVNRIKIDYLEALRLLRIFLSMKSSTINQRYTIATAQIEVHKNPTYINLVKKIIEQLPAPKNI